MTDEEFKLFRTLIYDECGIDLQNDKITLLDTRVRKRMAICGVNSYYQYYQFLKQGLTGARELIVLMDLMTINETMFFRNKPQFELLKTFVLPEIITRKKQQADKRLRIWSAGCSSGQEPYSIAMTILETIPFPDLWDIKILASDLSLRMLEIAQNGCYNDYQLRGLDSDHLESYFIKAEGGYQIKKQIQRLVTFDYHNLKHDNGLRGFDIIFCRNVMIYFDERERARLVERFARSLILSGYIFIGHAETLQGVSERFKMLHQNKGIAYRREE
ncbi:MAG: protein-glutamate O-methyltransferase [Acidobacteriota bacterium]